LAALAKVIARAARREGDRVIGGIDRYYSPKAVIRKKKATEGQREQESLKKEKKQERKASTLDKSDYLRAIEGRKSFWCEGGGHAVRGNY